MSILEKSQVYLLFLYLYVYMHVDLASSSSCQFLFHSIELSTYGDKCGCFRLECVSLYCQSTILTLKAFICWLAFPQYLYR